jgi:tRNA1Val (adenine37-N6)-methyltransferase
MEIILKEDERLDSLEYKGLKIIQNKNLYRFTSDAVLLANSVKAGNGDRVIEFGSGSGVVGTLVAAKTGARVVGIEIQAALFDTAVRSAELNGMTDSLKFFNLDIRNLFLNKAENNTDENINETKRNIDEKTSEAENSTDENINNINATINEAENDINNTNKKSDGADFFKIGSFDIAVSNPPFGKKSDAKNIANESERIARTEEKITLSEIVAAAARSLRFGGAFYTVVKALRLSETLYLMTKYGIEPKELTLVVPTQKKPPDACIIRGARGGKIGLKINEPLVVFDENGEYTRAVKKMYDIKTE